MVEVMVEASVEVLECRDAGGDYYGGEGGCRFEFESVF